MNQHCFVLDFSHSPAGRFKRIPVTYRTLLFTFLTFLLVITAVGAFLGSSYLRMSLRMSRYDRLAADFDRLRNRYQDLQKVSRQHTEQMASLETLASEVSTAYGLNEPAVSSDRDLLSASIDDASGVKESIAEYNFLKTASFGGIYRRHTEQWHAHIVPALWPLAGIIRSSFGSRSDPFSGEGTFHTSIDLAAPSGTPVRVTADGVIETAHWGGGYGKLVIVDHGNGVQTYYAHLSRLSVMAGQEVQAGQVIAYSGSTGRSTGPHMHYEVRLGGTPVNPYKFLPKADRPAPVLRKPSVQLATTAPPAVNDFGL